MDKITFEKLQDGTCVITVQSINDAGKSYIRQEIFKQVSVFDALKSAMCEANSNAVLAEVRAELLKELLVVFKDLLDEAKCYYHLYPNSHRGTVEEYFEIEDELIKKVSEHFS